MADRRSKGEHGADERETLQRRMAQFAGVTFALALATDVINLAVLPPADWLSLGSLLDRVMTVMLAVMWLACRRGQRSFRFLRTLDAVGFAVITIGLNLMGRFMAPQVAASFGVDPAAPGVDAMADIYTVQALICGGAVLFMFRAALIPSPPRFTLFVTGVLGSPFLLTGVLLAPAVGGELALQDPDRMPGAILDSLLWWGIITAVCTATSAVIYGLRRDVRAAQRLGQYTLVEKIGEGAMGAVYRADHARLRRPTAIKLLPPDRLSEAAIARFEDEVQLTASLTHPNTVTVFDYGRTDDGVFYYAMEFLDGATLAEVVAVDGAQPSARAARILLQAADALQEAHEVGLIHRDIKPANVMLTRQGIDVDAVKLLDFGLVRAVDRAGADITSDDAIVGTPLYMAPEAIRDPNTVGTAADLYSLGAVGYFLVTGSHVFAGDSVVEICAHHLHSDPEPPSSRLGEPLAPDLERLILDCLHKDPAARPGSAAEVVARLQASAVDAWSLSRAEAWWDQHRPELHRRRGTPERMSHVRLSVA